LKSQDNIKEIDEANEAMNKHLKDQLEFAQNEKNHMRDTWLSTRHRLRQVEEVCDIKLRLGNRDLQLINDYIGARSSYESNSTDDCSIRCSKDAATRGQIGSSSIRS
jgi:hypothetical protein